MAIDQCDVSGNPLHGDFSRFGWIQRREYRTVRQTVELYRAVTVDEVNAVLRKYPLTKNMTVAVGPLESLDVNGR